MPRGIPNIRATAGVDFKPETRAEQTRRKRRMQPGSAAANGIKLSFDESRFDREKMQLRWVREDRVQQLYAQDWDRVSDKDAKTDGTGLGSVPEQHGGIDEAGKPYRMVLMSKYKDWFDEDQKKKHAKLDEIDEQIRRGRNPTPEAAALGATYTPNGVNIIDKI